MSSFTTIQTNSLISPFGTTSPIISFGSAVGGDAIIVASFLDGNVGIRTNLISVTDDGGSEYNLFSQSAGYQQNTSQGVITIFVALTPTPIAKNITFHLTTASSTNSQCLKIIQYQCPNTVQCFGAYCDVFISPAVFFTGLGNNGTTNTAPNGPVTLSIDRPGSPGAILGVAAVALMNQFSDVLIVADWFISLSSDLGDYPWTFTSPSGGTIEITVQQGNPSYISSCLLDQDFPYIGTSLTILCNDPPNGTVGIMYTHNLEVYGGTPPYSFALVGGTLPPGLTLNTSTGNISGTPTLSGTYTFTVQVTDSASATNQTTCTINICPSSGGGNYAFLSRC